LSAFSKFCYKVVGQIRSMADEAPYLARQRVLSARHACAEARPVPLLKTTLAWLEHVAPLELPSELERALRAPKCTLFELDAFARLSELNALAPPTVFERSRWDLWHMEARHGWRKPKPKLCLTL
jgi:hypothetical protein